MRVGDLASGRSGDKGDTLDLSLVASLPAREHAPIMMPACKQSERMSGSGLIETWYSEVGEGVERTRPGQARPCVGRLTKWNYFFAEAFTAPGE